MRGQAAVETLLIYGVAILVVMLAIGALIGFGVLDLGSLLPDKCEITGVSIGCSDYLIEQNQVTLQLRNSIGKNIVIANITIVGEGDNTGLWGTRCIYNASDETDVNRPRQDMFLAPPSYDSLLVVNGEQQSFILSNCNIQVPSGKKISGKIIIRYANVANQDQYLIKTAYGTINAKVA